MASSPPTLEWSFPDELIVQIFEGLRASTDFATLRNCALVSRQWLPVARESLFCRVSGTSNSKEDLPDFLSRLKGSRFLHPYVKELHLTQGMVEFSLILEVGRLLPSLRMLLSAWVCLLPYPNTKLTEQRIPTRLHELKLFSITVTSASPPRPWRHLLDVLGAFSFINRVFIENPSLQAALAPSPPLASRDPCFTYPKTRVRSLVFSPNLDVEMVELAKGMLETIDLGELHTLDIRLTKDTTQHGSLQDILDVTTSLKTLYLRFDGLAGGTSTRFSLASCVSLESLHFETYHVDLGGLSLTELAQNNIACILRLLSSLTLSPDLSSSKLLPQPPLSKFTLLLFVLPPATLGPENKMVKVLENMIWSRVAHALEQFPQLQDVEIGILTLPRVVSAPAFVPALESFKRQMKSLSRHCSVRVLVREL